MSSWNETNLAPPPPPQEPQKKGCGGAGKWIACGCIAVALGFFAFIAGVFWIAMVAIRGSDVYAAAIERAQRDPRVVQALGEPIVPSWFPTGSISVSNDKGSADTTIPIKGPKGTAKIHVVATKSGYEWKYATMVVTTAGGEVIDLLAPPKSPLP